MLVFLRFFFCFKCLFKFSSWNITLFALSSPQLCPDLLPPTQLHSLPLFLKHKQEHQQSPKTITINVPYTLYHRNSLKQNDKTIFDFPKGIHLPVPEFALICCSLSDILYVSNYNKTKQKDNTIVLGFINP